MNMIEVESLTKRFGQFTAVDAVSFQVDKGEIFGLLGPNGAGKTTTIRCLLTLIPMTDGKAKVAGIDVLKKPQQAREVSGYVPQDVSVDGDLTGYENLLFYAKLFHVPRSARKERIREVIRFMELSEKANELARNYSGGMMRRLEIGQVLVNRPRVLFLDEPSIGLDPVAKRMVWDYIKQLRDEFDATILTHHPRHERGRSPLRPHRHYERGQNRRHRPAGQAQEQSWAAISSVSPRTITIATRCCKSLGYQLLPQSQDSACDLVVDDGEKKIPGDYRKTEEPGCQHGISLAESRHSG